MMTDETPVTDPSQTEPEFPSKPGAAADADPVAGPNFQTKASKAGASQTTTSQAKTSQAKASKDTKVGIFGPPPLLPGDDAEAYDKIRQGIRDSVKPRDFIEELFVEDLIYETWQIGCQRRYSGALLKDEARDKIAGKLNYTKEFHEDSRSAIALTQRWARGDQTAMERIETILAELGTDVPCLIAKAFESEMEYLERNNELIDAAVYRREKCLREIDRRRSAFASERKHDPKHDPETVIEVEYEVSAPPTAIADPE